MASNLSELKNQQDLIRSKLFETYKSGGKSILSTSKIIKIPYTSLRSFMMGKNLSYLNLLKIKSWLGE
jgi:hypothetical protein